MLVNKKGLSGITNSSGEYGCHKKQSLSYTDYESGVSSYTLETKYGVARSTIRSRAKVEKWLKPSPTNVVGGGDGRNVGETPVERAEADLMYHLDGHPEKAKLQLNQHKLFADALSQYKKIKALLPPEEQEQSNDSLKAFLAKCTNEELAVVRPIIKAVTDREREAEEKITPIRKIR